MGGTKALAELRSKRIYDSATRGAFHKSYGAGSKYAAWLAGGARAVFDGSRAWIEVYGKMHPLHGKPAREVERRASRWDFLSRYVGDGVQVRHAGTTKDESGRLYDVVHVDDRRFGRPPIVAYFSRETHLLVTEEQTFVEELPGLHRVEYVMITDYGEYRSEGRAKVWHKSVTKRLLLKSTQREIDREPRCLPVRRSVDYSAVADSVFEVSHTGDSWSGLPTPENDGTLWVQVEFDRRPMEGRPALPGAPEQLSTDHKADVTQQVFATVATIVDRLGWFQRVAFLGESSQVQSHDFVFRVRMMAKKVPDEPWPGRVFYGGQLLEGVSRAQVMGDGPLPEDYFGWRFGGDLGKSKFGPGEEPPENRFRRNCRFYACSVYTADDLLAYADEVTLAALILRSYAKGSQVTRGSPPDPANEYNRDCCYCQAP